MIGGSGFYKLDGLTDTEQVTVSTPYGEPSSPITIGTLHGRRVAFIARHGEGHRLLPSEVPARANIYALRLLGVDSVFSVSAVGSLQQRYEPLHAVVPDQVIDRTRGRVSTFFGDGAVAHIGLADPFCPALGALLVAGGREAGVTMHEGGAMVVIEGPAFSTRAESELYRSWDAAIIGMTALPEAKLAREAELCYASICFVTDYDVWHETEADVSASAIFQTLQRNVVSGREAVSIAIAAIEDARACTCRDALGSALVTDPRIVPAETRARLGAIVERYWGAQP